MELFTTSNTIPYALTDPYARYDSYAYTWYPGTSRVQQRTTTLPAIPTSQNGSGVAATRRDYYDSYGNLTWHMDERGFLTRTTFDLPTGATIVCTFGAVLVCMVIARSLFFKKALEQETEEEELAVR